MGIVAFISVYVIDLSMLPTCIEFILNAHKHNAIKVREYTYVFIIIVISRANFRIVIWHRDIRNIVQM